MSDFYTLYSYLQLNNKPQPDILASLGSITKTEEELKSNSIEDMIITDDVDEFINKTKKENIAQNITHPTKNKKRRINIPNAEIKQPNHYRFKENFEGYNEDHYTNRNQVRTYTENPRNQDRTHTETEEEPYNKKNVK